MRKSFEFILEYKSITMVSFSVCTLILSVCSLAYGLPANNNKRELQQTIQFQWPSYTHNINSPKNSFGGPNVPISNTNQNQDGSSPYYHYPYVPARQQPAYHGMTGYPAKPGMGGNDMDPNFAMYPPSIQNSEHFINNQWEEVSEYAEGSTSYEKMNKDDEIYKLLDRIHGWSSESREDSSDAYGHIDRIPQGAPHKEICEALFEENENILKKMFGSEIEAVNFSFLQCMTKTEVMDFLNTGQDLMGMDLDFLAIRTADGKTVPRMPLVTCVFEALYYESLEVLNTRPEDDAKYMFPEWCGRNQFPTLETEECAAALDQVFPSLGVVSEYTDNSHPEDWRDLSYLDNFEDNEKCHLIELAKGAMFGSGKEGMVWKHLGIAPVQNMIPTYQCYLRHMIENLKLKLMENKEASETVEQYCYRLPRADLLGIKDSQESISAELEDIMDVAMEEKEAGGESVGNSKRSFGNTAIKRVGNVMKSFREGGNNRQ